MTKAHVIAANAAKGFAKYDCWVCAENIRKALMDAGYNGRRIELRGAGGSDFMICLSYDEGQASISLNGRHVGIQVAGRVFDNLHLKGMPLKKWLNDFDAVGGVIVQQIEDF